MTKTLPVHMHAVCRCTCRALVKIVPSQIEQLASKKIFDDKIREGKGPPPPGGVLPYMGYKGMCGPKGYGFSAVFVINKVSILAVFGQFGHKYGFCNRKSTKALHKLHLR